MILNFWCEVKNEVFEFLNSKQKIFEHLSWQSVRSAVRCLHLEPCFSRALHIEGLATTFCKQYTYVNNYNL